MLHVSNLVVFSKDRQILVKNLSFDIKKGEILALLGVNGSGKTSIALGLSGHLPCDADDITLNHISLKEKSAHDIVNMGISFVAEEKLLFQDLTVRENLEVALMAKNIILKRDRLEERLNVIFSLFPRLFERQKQKSKTLSGGEQQMLTLARALMLNPSLLILDEPSQGLSIQMVDVFFNALQALKKEGLSIFLIEQNIELALSVADEAIVIRNGEIILKENAYDMQKRADLFKICING